MSCAIWEERVALFSGGDLGTAEAGAVERHLGQCAACSALAADLRSELDELRQAHREPLAPEHYAAVRARVLAELAVPPRRSVAWPWAWAAALAVAAAGACVVWVIMKPAAIPAPELPRLVAAAPKQSRAQRAPRQGAVISTHVRRRRTERAAPSVNERRRSELAEVVVPPPPAPPAAEDPPVRMVQLATADPNVVIYWLFEEKGEER